MEQRRNYERWGEEEKRRSEDDKLHDACSFNNGMRCIAMCAAQKEMWSCVRNQKQEPRKTGNLSRRMTRRVQANTWQAATEALSVIKDKSWHGASPWHWSESLQRGARQTWNITFYLQRFLSTSYTAPTIRDPLKPVCSVLPQCTTVLPLAQGQQCSPLVIRLRW